MQKNYIQNLQILKHSHLHLYKLHVVHIVKELALVNDEIEEL